MKKGIFSFQKSFVVNLRDPPFKKRETCLISNISLENFNLIKNLYLIHTSSDEAFKGTSKESHWKLRLQFL